ncbi:hypothetical protein HN873_047556 [Arachis hypogaea]
MAASSDKAYSTTTTITSTNNHQGNSTSSEEVANTATKSNVGKELARRALLRSHQRGNRRRKPASNAAKSLPSRLSKVSLGDDSSDS